MTTINISLPLEVLQETIICLRERISGLQVEARYHTDPVIRSICARQLQRSNDALHELTMAELSTLPR